MKPTEFTKICTSYCEDAHIRKGIESWEKDPPTYGECDTFQALSMLFTTYPKNVPEPPDYTVDDMVALANDPILLKLYEEPLVIMNMYHQERPALYVTPHAACELSRYMEQPNDLDNATIVVRAHGSIRVLDIREVISACALPDKYVYGCVKCLGTHTPINGACVVRNALGANNPYYLNQGYETSTTLQVREYRRIKTWGKYESPFKSQHTQIAGHLYVSPVMFYDNADASRYHRNRDNAFVGFRKIGIDNIDLDTYEEHKERKLEAAKTRAKHRDNEKEYCTKCSVKETCHDHFKHKKKFCTEPLPPSAEIDEAFLQQEKNPDKELLVDILMACGLQEVKNPGTGRKVDAYVSLHNNHGGLGYQVMSRSSGRILAHGTKRHEWEEFKRNNNINTTYSDIARKTLAENIEKPAFFAKLIACAYLKQSPRMVSAFHSTTYEKAYIDVSYGRLEVRFRYPSRRSICPWSYEVKDWDDLFRHYGRIPGFR